MSLPLIPSTPEALAWVARLAGLALGLDALELLALRRAGAFAIWTDPLVARDLTVLPRPLARLAALTLSARGFIGVQLAHAAAAGALLALGPGPWAALALGAHVLVCMRWRGTLNGGSDQLKVVVLSGLTIAALDPALATVGLAYVAAQTILSYFVAGVVKLIEPTWRSGEAIDRLTALPRYGVPTRVASAMTRVARPLAWGVMTFELLSPLAFSGPRAAAVILATAAGFHAVNAAALGLNRFFWAWVSAYPAVLWASALVG
jgi:hypothetical protein